MSILVTHDDRMCNAASVLGSGYNWPASEAETVAKRSMLMLFDALIVNDGIQRDSEEYWTAMVNHINRDIRA